jgi:biopolymer transport protein ExbD
MKVNIEPDDLDVRIEMIPLVDVIFCILAFFILAAVGLARGEGLNIDLPSAETGQTQLDKKVGVEIDALGQIKVQDTPITEEQLTQFLAAYVKQNPKGVIELYADKLVSYGQVVRLIDLLQKVGGNRVSLGTQSLSATNSAPNNSLNQPLNPQQGTSQPLNPLQQNSPFPGGTTSPLNSGSPLFPETSPLSPNVSPKVPGLQQTLPPTTAPALPASPTSPRQP